MIVPTILGKFVSRAEKSVVDRALESPERILLVKQAERLGNIVLLNSAVSALSNRFPDAAIDLLLPAKFAEIMDGDKRINSVISVYKKDYIPKPWKLIELLRRLRNSEYDLAIDCSDVNSHSSTDAAYTLLSGARVTAGWETGDFFDVEVPRHGESIHASEMYIRLVSGVFGERIEGEPYFEIGSRSARDGKPLIGINCGGRDSKKWPLENFIRLGEVLSEKNISAEYILGPDEEAIREPLLKNIPPLCVLLPLQPCASISEHPHGHRRA